MTCPYCNDENRGQHERLGRREDMSLTVRFVGWKCTSCGQEYTVKHKALTDDAFSLLRKEDDFNMDLFEDDMSPVR